MYAGVPAIVPVPPSARPLARPKSITTTRPARVSITFSGLKSRCTRPAWWIASSPDRNCDAISAGLLKRERAALAAASRPASCRRCTPSTPAPGRPPPPDRRCGRRWGTPPRGPSAPPAGACSRARSFSARSATHGLERDVHAQLQVEGPPHLTHPAPAEKLPHLVALAQDAARVRPVEGRELRSGSRPRPESRRARLRRHCGHRPDMAPSAGNSVPQSGQRAVEARSGGKVLIVGDSKAGRIDDALEARQWRRRSNPRPRRQGGGLLRLQLADEPRALALAEGHVVLRVDAAAPSPFHWKRDRLDERRLVGRELRREGVVRGPGAAAGDLLGNAVREQLAPFLHDPWPTGTRLSRPSWRATITTPPAPNSTASDSSLASLAGNA